MDHGPTGRGHTIAVPAGPRSRQQATASLPCFGLKAPISPEFRSTKSRLLDDGDNRAAAAGIARRRMPIQYTDVTPTRQARWQSPRLASSSPSFTRTASPTKMLLRTPARSRTRDRSRAIARGMPSCCYLMRRDARSRQRDHDAGSMGRRNRRNWACVGDHLHVGAGHGDRKAWRLVSGAPATRTNAITATSARASRATSFLCRHAWLRNDVPASGLLTGCITTS